MYKVLIVDDEPQIREGMRTIIDWHSFGFRVCGIAANGREALEEHERQTPDLMIVDIRMPGMDGLKLIERIREKDEGVHFLILSGYSDFDYAKKAIDYRVDGYLLKPVDEDELTGFIARIRDMLVAEHEKRRQSEAEEQWRREQAIRSAACGTSPLSADDPSWDALAARLGMEWNGYQVVLLAAKRGGEDDGRLLASVKRKLAERFAGQSATAAVFPADPYIGLVIRDGIRGCREAREWNETLRGLCGEAADRIAGACGDIAVSLGRIDRSFASASRRLNRRLFWCEDGDILPPLSDGAGETGASPAPDAEKIADELFLALDIGHREAAARIANDALKAMEQSGMDGPECRSAAAHIASAALHKLSAVNAAAASLLRERPDILSDIYETADAESLRRHLNGIWEAVAERSGAAQPERIVKQMKELIHRNYDQNLKLETLAEVFHYNSGYLGKLFKSETGDYFNNYVDKVRMEKAKELLAQGLKVHQVAERVGYATVDYFYSKFKKYAGKSPSAFRGKHSGE